MDRPPLLGISIPAFKRINMLGRLLQSIHTDSPIIVSDNGCHLPADFKDMYSSVQFLGGLEVPVLRNWNRAAVSQTTEWIIMPGDDDLYYPKSFEIIESTLAANPLADIVFFGHHIIDEHDQVMETWRPDPTFLRAPYGFEAIKLGVLARPCSIAFRRSVYQRLGGFNECFSVTAGDNDFYQRASLVGNLLCVPEIVSGYRVWNTGSTRLTIATSEWLEEIDLWCNSIKQFSSLNSDYLYPKSLQDEIYMANLRAGIGLLKERGEYVAAWRHAFSNRYPYKASLKSHAKLLAHLLVPCLI